MNLINDVFFFIMYGTLHGKLGEYNQEIFSMDIKVIFSNFISPYDNIIENHQKSISCTRFLCTPTPSMF